MIRLVCGKCGKRYQIEDRFAGKRIICKGCASDLRIPESGSGDGGVVDGGGSGAGGQAAGARGSVPKAGSKPAKQAYDDIDDPFGLNDAAEAEGEAEGGAAPLYLPRGSGSSDGPGVNWMLIGGAIAMAVLLMLAGLMMTVRRAGPKVPPGAQGVGDEVASVPAEAEDGSGEAGTVAAAASTDSGRFVAGSQKAAGKAARSVSWNVEIDPAPAEMNLTIPPDAQVSIPIPQAYSSDRVLYPTTASPFVALGGNDAEDQQRTVIDLRNGRSVGQLVGRLDVNKPMALSSDGKYLVAHANQTKPRETRVWSVSDGRQLGAIQEQDNKPPQYADFVSASEVLITAPYFKKLEIWDFVEGKKTREIPMELSWNLEGVALSPGRRYLGLASRADKRLVVVDLKSGTIAGGQTLPSEGSYDADPKGLAFSADGVALTLLYELQQNMHLATWDVATGQQESDHFAEGRDGYGPDRHFEGPNLKWLPDGSGWLVHDQTIVDRQTGQKLWALSFDKASQGFVEAPRKVIDAGRVLAVAEQKSRQQTLVVVPLPREQIQMAQKLAREGGAAVDATLPPLTSVETAGARAIELPAGEVPWKVQVDPRPAGAAALPRKAIALAAKGMDVVGLALSGPEAARGVVMSGPGGRLGAAGRAQQGGENRRIQRIDLAKGKAEGQYEVAPVFDLAGMSPDGKSLLVILAESRDRLDILGSEDGKPVAGWRPVLKGGVDGNAVKVTWCAFLGNDRVFTLDSEGNLELWGLPKVALLYRVTNVAQVSPAISPGGKSLAFVSGTSVYVVDGASGEVQGRAGAPPLSAASASASASGDGEAGALAVRADGEELAGVVHGMLVRWEVKSGRVLQELPAPVKEARKLAYTDAGHLLIDDTSLFNIEHERIIWSFKNGQPATTSPDGAFWVCAGTDAIRPVSLRAFELPGAEVSATVTQAFQEGGNPLLKPGGAVAITIQANPPREGESFRSSLAEKLSKNLQELQINANKQSRVNLIVTMREGKSNTLEMRRYTGAGQPEVRNVTVQEVEWEVSLSDGKGQPAKILGDVVGVPFFVSLQMPAGDNDLDGFVRQSFWDEAQRRVLAAALPYYAARKGSGLSVLPGLTDLVTPYR